MSAASPTRPSAARLTAYAGPGVPVAATGLPLVVFLPPYFAGELGLDLAAVGLIFGLVRGIDTIFDPVVGHWADNTRTRFGRFKPWIMVGAILTFIATAAVFFAPQGIGLWYLGFGLAALYTGQSMLNVPHISWGATLTDDYHQRSRIYSFWQGGHLAGLILVLALPAVLGVFMGAAAPPAVYAMGAFVLVSIPLTVGAALILVPRTRGDLTPAHMRWADVKRVFRDTDLRLLIIADVSVHLAGGATGSLFRFFAEEVRGFTDTLSAIGLLAYFVSGLVGLPLWLRLAKRIGKARTGACAAAYGGIAHVAASFVFSADRPIASLIAIMFVGLSYAAPAFLLRAMLADHADAEKAAGSADRIGLLNALLTTAQKLGFVVPVAVLFPLLALYGFDPARGSANSDAALAAVEIIWIVSVPLLMLPGIWLMARYRNDQKRHVARRTAAGATP
ncbi:MAG: MFS transporter [Pseudomonadota bacterium]